MQRDIKWGSIRGMEKKGPKFVSGREESEKFPVYPEGAACVFKTFSSGSCVVKNV